MKPHLVIGATGLVGAPLVRAVTRARLPAVGTRLTLDAPDARPLDIRDRAQVLDLVADVAPGVVYLPAAIANVDACEERPQEAWLVNVAGLRNVVLAANQVGAVLVFFSTDYIFDGTAGPYREDDPARPIGEYGRQKVIGEQHVALHAREFLIVRTTVVYGWEHRGKNFVTSLVASLARGNEVRVPVDQVGTPTYAPNLAEVVVGLVTAGVRGVVNVAGPDRVSRVALAHEAAAVFGLDPGIVVPTCTRDLGQRAARPLEAGLVIDRVRGLVPVPLVGYREGLRTMAAERKP
jgi:dTDP-4-dehydrorhamnose reductase